MRKKLFSLMKIKMDLFLGGDMGCWVLTQIDPCEVGHVVTLESSLALLAEKRGMQVLLGNAQEEVFNQKKRGLCVHYPVIFKKAFIDQYEVIYNLHPGFLPWGRGFYPIFWALWENHPAGATLHRIDDRLDRGYIVDQISVPYSEEDTGWTLFQRVRKSEKKLFLKYWKKMGAEKILPENDSPEGGSYHSKADFAAIKILPPFQMSGDRLLKLARCLTFKGYPGFQVKMGSQYAEVVLKKSHFEEREK